MAILALRQMLALLAAVSSSGLVLPSRAQPHRMLRLRGGSAVAAPAAPVTSQPSQQQAKQPAAPRLLWLVGGSDALVVKVPRVELSSANIENLQLNPGDRIRLRRAKPRTGIRSPLSRPIPDETLGEVVEDPTLGELDVRIPARAMEAMRLQMGDGVLLCRLATLALSL